MSGEGKAMAHAAPAGAPPAFNLEIFTQYLEMTKTAAKKFVYEAPLWATVAMVAAAVLGFALFLPELAAKIIIFIPLAAFVGFVSHAMCCDEDYSFQDRVKDGLRPARAPAAYIDMDDFARSRSRIRDSRSHGSQSGTLSMSHAHARPRPMPGQSPSLSQRYGSSQRDRDVPGMDDDERLAHELAAQDGQMQHSFPMGASYSAAASGLVPQPMSLSGAAHYSPAFPSISVSSPSAHSHSLLGNDD